jgi:hypothetical protein
VQEQDSQYDCYKKARSPWLLPQEEKKPPEIADHDDGGGTFDEAADRSPGESGTDRVQRQDEPMSGHHIAAQRQAKLGQTGGVAGSTAVHPAICIKKVPLEIAGERSAQTTCAPSPG